MNPTNVIRRPQLSLFAVLLFIAMLFVLAQSAFAAPPVTWNENPTGDQVTHYTVYKKVVSGTTTAWESVGVLDMTVTPKPALVIVLPTQTTVATYAVTAKNVSGESAKSNEVTVPGVPGAPTLFRLELGSVTTPGM
jgi:hypothetical protein